METFWIIMTFIILLSYGTGIVLFNHKLARATEGDTQHVDSRKHFMSLRISRRAMQRVLGAVWFFDGLFQLKPHMFTESFVKEVILPTGQGQPAWLASMVQFGGNFVLHHLVLWNTLFALVQLGIGIALLFNVKTKQTILVSIVWSVVVWIFGEGAGQILSGQTLLINGAPGAVLLYALLSIAIWPKKDHDVRAWGERSIRFAQLSLAVLLTAGFALHLQSAYLKPTGFTQAIAVPWLASALGNGAVVVSLLLGFVELGLALLLFFKVKPSIATLSVFVLSILFWWIGQSFGQIFDPLATDFNSGLLMALLAICANPMFVGNSLFKSLEETVA